MINRDRTYPIHKSENANSSSPRAEATGYLHALYCESLNEFGTPRFLSESRGWILERQIPNSDCVDAMGCYPLFACQSWSQLQSDLESIGNSLISLVVVTDPFGEYDATLLKECFPDLAMPFKEHFVVDLSRPPDRFVRPHHQRNARKALREIRVEECSNPLEFLDDWINLYDALKVRHNITGMTAFSRKSFAKQLCVPGVVMLRAIHNDATVGIVVWYRQVHRAYYHLGAYNALGYELGASFALFSYAIEHFADAGMLWLNLGAGAGLTHEGSGLDRFKEGWSTGTRTAYLCGRIFDRKNYESLAVIRNASRTAYFPAYRFGEFV